MNYLAHAYLSFGQTDLTVGNLISDFIKGKKKFDYPVSIQQGIALHRAIDEYTDAHPLVHEAAQVFKPAYGLYAGPLVDVAFDHFLANDPVIFPTGNELAAFSQSVYEKVRTRQDLLPEKFARMFPYMQSQNWLHNYRYKEGIYNSFAGLHRRARYMPPPQEACRLLDEQYQTLQQAFNGFFPQLLKHAETQYHNTKN